MSIATESSGPVMGNNVRGCTFFQKRTDFSPSILEQCGRLLTLVVDSKILWKLSDEDVSGKGDRSGDIFARVVEQSLAEISKANIGQGPAGAGERGRKIY